MTNELEMKLKEYGFPEHYSESVGINTSVYCLGWLYPNDPNRICCDIIHEDKKFFYRDAKCEKFEIKTDSDWKAVAAFVRFIKGE